MAKSSLMEDITDDCNSDTWGYKCAKETADQTREYRLGGDDPFWPHYLKEAEKYDDMMVDKWEKKMDTLLLFATLFSAIVTAFVIESSQNLQPDNAAITAAAIVEIAGILRNRSTNDQQGPTFQSPDDFQPTRSAFFVNFVWFISLCLSITVALLAGLAKQWSNSLRWDRTAPPCNQARIRQARFNKLIHGRTELVISAIRVIMDAALGLFLVGLLAFLHDLNQDIYIAALVVTAITGVFYFGTTLVPFFVPFSPYETPVSSRKAWAFFCQLWLALNNWVRRCCPGNNAIEFEANFKTLLSGCEKNEKAMASNTSPDELTGDALKWIILHSQKAEPREMAIRAIATLDSELALRQLGSPGILPKVIQSFTSCFIVRDTEDGETKLDIRESIEINTVSLHGRALARLITQSLHPGNKEEVRFAESGWVVDKRTRRVVMDGFEYLGRLADCEHRENCSGEPNPEANLNDPLNDPDFGPKHTTHTRSVRAPDNSHDNEEKSAPFTPLDQFGGDLSLFSSSTRPIDSDVKRKSSNCEQSSAGSRILAHGSLIFPNNSQPSNAETAIVVRKQPANGCSKSLSTGSKARSATELITLNTKNNHDFEAGVWALVGLSAWHDFIEHDKGLRFNQGQAIRDLTKSLQWSLSPDLRKAVLCALTKEISYWNPTISTKNRKETLQHLIKLIPETPFELQPQFACTLAVLALNLNHGTSYLAPSSPNSDRAPEDEFNNGMASLLMNHYANRPGQLARDGRSLLLFSLTGLMEYYEHCDFDEEAHHNMKQIAQRFQELDDIGKPQSIDIPATIATIRGTEMKFIDTRDYYVSTLLLYLKLPRTRQHSQHKLYSILKSAAKAEYDIA